MHPWRTHVNPTGLMIIPLRTAHDRVSHYAFFVLQGAPVKSVSAENKVLGASRNQRELFKLSQGRSVPCTIEKLLKCNEGYQIQAESLKIHEK